MECSYIYINLFFFLEKKEEHTGGGQMIFHYEYKQINCTSGERRKKNTERSNQPVMMIHCQNCHQNEFDQLMYSRLVYCETSNCYYLEMLY